MVLMLSNSTLLEVAVEAPLVAEVVSVVVDMDRCLCL
jgi:hypothetical protein